ncbi:CRISPR-associated helicase Cas3' [Clostridium perfringens]
MFLSRPGEELSMHVERVENNYRLLKEKKGMGEAIDRMVDKLLREEGMLKYYDFINRMVGDAIKLHDEGKKNKYFQVYVGNEDEVFKNVKYNDINKEHSIISSYYFLGKCMGEIELLGLKGKDGRKEKRFLKEIGVILAYVISRHHGDLVDFNKSVFLKKILDHADYTKESFFDGFDSSVIDYYKSSTYDFNGAMIYFFTRYVYSILVTCDFLAVHYFKKGVPLNINVINDEVKNRFVSKFNESDIVKGVRSYEENKNFYGVNKYRCEMFLESEINLRERFSSSNIFYLEAPTGCGKSVTGLNLSLNMIDGKYNKVIYVAPFTNIIEQTYKDICFLIGEYKKDIVNISCKEEIVTEDDLITDYDVDCMDNLLINYPYSVISHVRLFNMLFGYKKRHAIMMSLLADSVIVIDEIQSYKNKLWMPIINFLREYSEMLNLKIVIMSATLPKMDALLQDEEYKIENLIDNREYYYDFFKTRVNVDFSLLDNEDFSEQALLDKVDEFAKKGKRILIGTITTKTCDKIFDIMDKKYRDEGYEVYKLQGRTEMVKKNYIIGRIKEKVIGKEDYLRKKIILVATQCCEAGLDIDMEIGFKNIAIPDADEQFCGRIERNFRNKGIVYFFKLDDPYEIYKEDFRVEKTLEELEMQKILVSKDFDKLYSKVYDRLILFEKGSYNNILDNASNLNYASVWDDMKLIDDDDNVKLLMLCRYKTENGVIINMKDELEKYNSIRCDSSLGYSEKEIFLSRFKKIFDLFTYTVNRWDFDKIDTSGRFGVYNLVEDAEMYFSNLDGGCITVKSELDYEQLIQGRLFY